MLNRFLENNGFQTPMLKVAATGVLACIAGFCAIGFLLLVMFFSVAPMTFTGITVFFGGLYLYFKLATKCPMCLERLGSDIVTLADGSIVHEWCEIYAEEFKP